MVGFGILQPEVHPKCLGRLNLLDPESTIRLTQARRCQAFRVSPDLANLGRDLCRVNVEQFALLVNT